MAYSAKVIADSMSPDGVRLSTLELTYPRFVHAELMTHRVFSRNSASSRAIPVEKMLAAIENDPVMPVWWGKNQSGMQANEELSDTDRDVAASWWLLARNNAVKHARRLQAINTHKQITNRVTEPWMWITVLVTATEWNNFYALRLHKDAQPEIRRAAVLAYEAWEASRPRELARGEWHLPLVTDEERSGSDLYDWVRVSIGRCARVSYLTHDGRRDPQADIALADRLQTSGHMSPFEHAAKPISLVELTGIRKMQGMLLEHLLSEGSTDPKRVEQIVDSLEFTGCGNVRLWTQARKEIIGESVFAR